jgi:hypothetical protein
LDREKLEQKNDVRKVVFRPRGLPTLLAAFF